MKKLLSILLIGTLVTITSNNITACRKNKDANTEIANKQIETSLISSVETATWFQKISSADNLSLINNKQLTISGIENSSPISDINLDFTGNHVLDDGCDGAPNFLYYFNNMYFASRLTCGGAIRHYTLGDPIDGNYFTFKDAKNIDGMPTSTGIITSSNNELFTQSTHPDYNMWNITDPTNPKNLTSSLTENSNYIYDYEGILYVGTVNGLYKSEDDGTTYSLVKNTEGLNITSITASTEKNLVFFGTQENGLWSFNTTSESPIQVSKTAGKKINSNSVFISDNNLYFGIENEGLCILNNLSTGSINRLVGTDIAESDNVKSIVETDSQQKIVLTDKNIVLF